MRNAQETRESVARSLRGFRHQIPSQVLEELAQEALLRTLDAPGVNDTRAFARRTGRHLAIDWLRKRREIGLPELPDPADRSWADRIDARIDTERALALLALAPRSYRTTVERLYVAGEEVDDLVRAEPGATDGPEAWNRLRDVVYKRRQRGLGWVRRRLTRPAAR